MMQIYFPMSARVITKGHIKCLEYLTRMGFVTIGLLTSNAMKGYKNEVVPYDDRYYILETIAIALGDIDIVPQETLDPSTNIRKHKCNAIASGDGFEKEELEAIRKYRLSKIEIKLRGEKGVKKYSSSQILNEKSKTKKTSKARG